MPTPQRRGLARLVATDGHSHWVEPVLRGLPNGLAYTLSADCTFGGVALTHYVARGNDGRVYWQNSPHIFFSLADAEAARDELAARQPQDEGE